MLDGINEWREDDPLVMAACPCKSCGKPIGIWCVTRTGKKTPGLHSPRRKDYKKLVAEGKVIT